MMSNPLAKVFGRNRPRSPRRGLANPRSGKRFAPLTEFLEGRITPSTVNIVAVSVSEVDANDKMIPAGTIYAGDQIYIDLKYTTINLPSNAQYRIRFVVNNSTAYTKYYTDGDANPIPFTATYDHFYGPFVAQGGPATGPLSNQVTATVDPDSSVKESTYTDNSASGTFAGVSTQYQLQLFDQSDAPPSSVVAGRAFSVRVAVEDQYQNVCVRDTGLVTASAPNDSSGTILGGDTMVNANGGYAFFDTLTLNKAGTNETILFSRTNLNGLNLNSITVTPSTATQVVINRQPATATAGVNFSTLQVFVEDAYNNIETADNSTLVTVSLATGQGPLTGPNTATSSQGVATFGTGTGLQTKPLTDDLAESISLDCAGTTIDGGSLTDALSKVFPVMPAAADKLVIMTPPAAMATVGQPIGGMPTIAVEDQFNNIETLDNATLIVASPTKPGGPLMGTSKVTVANGLAVFSSLGESKVGNLTLQFTSPSVALGASASIAVSQGSPSLNWSPQVIALGSGVSSAQLDATASNAFGSIAGTYSYSPGLGAILPLGPHTFQVLFTPSDSTDYSPASKSLIISVLPATTTGLTASATSVNFKKPISFTATVTPTAGGPTPTGSVTFLDGSIVLGLVPLDATGRAKFSTAILPAGLPVITARYSGDTGDAPSSSAATTLHVHASPGGDFDGDGRADVATFDQSTATFYYIPSSGGTTITRQLGIATDANVPVTGDFDGDGKTDYAVFDKTSATFYIIESGGGTIVQQLGNPADTLIPVAGDFDGDGKTDTAIYDQTVAIYYVIESGGATKVQQFGNNTQINIPIAGDFDGDGKTDLGLYDQTTSTFLILESTGPAVVKQFGNSTHKNVPVATDFDGDGRTDFAIFDQTSAVFIALESSGVALFQQFGNAADPLIPVAADFDGDGLTDLALYDAALSEYLVIETGGGIITKGPGGNGHKSLPV